MTRQETIQAIAAKLSKLPDETLLALFAWVAQEDDVFEQQLRQDVFDGKLDTLITEAVAEDNAGETIDFTSCHEGILEAVYNTLPSGI